MRTDVITPAQLPEYFAGIAEDWNTLSYDNFLNGEFLRIAYMHAEFFATETGPDGAKWPALSPNTRKRVGVEGPHRILVDAGGLKKSLTGESGAADAVRIVEQTGDGWILQFGTWNQWSSLLSEGNPATNLPPRPHVGFTDEYLDEATERCADYAVSEMANAA